MTDFETADRDVNRAIRSWLREDRHEDVSRVAGAVLDQVDAIPQRRTTRWPARRTPTMNKIVGFGLAAAAVVAIALIGSQLFGSPDPGGTGSGTTSSPEPSVAEPTPTAQPSPSIDAGLPVGSSYALTDEGVPITATIPAPGWSVDEVGTGSIAKHGDGSAPDGAYVLGVWSGPDPRIPSDPCQWESTLPDTPATTLDEIVAALGSQATRNASAAEDVTVDGYAGKVITIEMPEGPYSASGNPDCDEDKFCTLAYGGPVCQMWFQEAGQIDELWIVDVDGEFLFVPGSYFSETPASVVDELGAFLGSMTFGE